jgi:hypothetical protein
MPWALEKYKDYSSAGEDKAELLKQLDNKIFDLLGINDGNAFYNARPESQEIQKNYLRLWREAVKKYHITSVGEKTQDILEDDNYHQANKALSIIGIGQKRFNPRYSEGWQKLPSGWYVYARE